MSRHRKQTAPDLKALEHIPAVREALRFVGLELVVRPLQAPAVAPAQAAPSPTQPAPTFDARAQWLAQQGDVDAALKSEMGTLPTATPASKPQTLPAAQRRAIERGFLAESGSMRAEKMAQFHTTGEPDIEPPVDTHELTTLSEAT